MDAIETASPTSVAAIETTSPMIDDTIGHIDTDTDTMDMEEATSMYSSPTSPATSEATTEEGALYDLISESIDDTTSIMSSTTSDPLAGVLVFIADFSGNMIWKMNSSTTSVFRDLKDGPKPFDITANIRQEKIYWTGVDSPNHGIWRASFCNNDTERIFLSKNKKLDWITIDKTSSTIYFSSRKNNTITSLNEIHFTQKIIVSGISYPRALVVDEIGRYLYWSTAEGIFKKSLLRDEEHNLVVKASQCCDALTIDATGQWLFYVSCNYTPERTPDTLVFNIFSLAEMIQVEVTPPPFTKWEKLYDAQFFEGSLYWMDRDIFGASKIIPGSNLDDVTMQHSIISEQPVSAQSRAMHLYLVRP
ncbi:low-density lipoprotein receptor-related protein 2-like [Diadema antillarum]|uniref:low-density lipoprotein receptor-related protein 2-like n=1 Tax=Diadema antillarum TaxID=105358 RepID=UPI003A8488C4